MSEPPAISALLMLSRSACRFVALGRCVTRLVLMTVVLTAPANGQTTRRNAKPIPAADVETQWRVIYLADKRIGYSRVTSSRLREGGRSVIRTVEETHMTVARFGQHLKMDLRETIVESTAGQILRFEMSMKNPPSRSIESIGEVNGSQLTLSTTVADRVQKSTKAWESDLRSTHYQDRLLKTRKLNTNETIELHVFLPQMNKSSKVTIKGEGERRTRLLDGRSHRLRRVSVSQDILPGQNMIAWQDAAGEIVKLEMPFLGSTMATYIVDEAEALKAIGGAELDLAVNTLVRLPKPLRNGHRSQRAVYRLSSSDPDALRIIPGTSGIQETRLLSDRLVEITVTRAKPPTGNRRLSVAEHYLEATQYLQSQDTHVAQHASRAAGNELNQWRAATAMEKYVFRKLRRKNFSTALASAAEVAKDMSGDCTEHAVLLAAMLRNRRIPSRIAVGLVYVESQLGFGGHMWTEAMIDGQWIPLDATLGRGGIGAAHIKLADSAFADDGPSPVSTFLPLFNLLGNVKIEVVSAE